MPIATALLDADRPSAARMRAGARAQAPVLVVAGSDAIRALLWDLLEDAGYAVRSARNGIEALDVLATGCPAVIVVERLLPIMDGEAFLRAYLAQPGPHAPAIGLTTRALPPHAAMATLAHAMLLAPFEVDELLALVTQFVAADEVPGQTGLATLMTRRQRTLDVGA
jgi:CheY-like chemotaxis protein